MDLPGIEPGRAAYKAALPTWQAHERARVLDGSRTRNERITNPVLFPIELPAAQVELSKTKSPQTGLHPRSLGLSHFREDVARHPCIASAIPQKRKTRIRSLTSRNGARGG